MNNKNQRYPAYPLITCDPYFNVWSMCDTLNGENTRHWTEKFHPMTGIVVIDGVPKVFMGRLYHNPQKSAGGPRNIEQKSVSVTPLTTVYQFDDEKIQLEVSFVTPLLTDDLMLMSRPVSYINYSMRAVDGKEHECTVYIDAGAVMAVNSPDEEVLLGRSDISVYASCADNHILQDSGDDLRINWGYLHLAAKSGKTGFIDDYMKKLKMFDNRDMTLPECRVKAGKLTNDKYPYVTYPALYHACDYKLGNEAIHDFICVGYNDIHSLEYFGKPVDAYYKKDGSTFYDALSDALENHDNIMERVRKADEKLMADAVKVSEDYARVLAVAYRQVIASHKLAFDGEKAIFVSKECDSNGCAATVDVTYPSFPMFVKYNPDLAEYMLNPIFDFADSDAWTFDFAPHDAGQYPLVNGQVYGKNAGEYVMSGQMPIEECGNMILCVAAICRARKNAECAEKHFDVLQKWADYLSEHGYDPENQLCTDDFAGHLAHNCNLSVKAIMGIAAWGMLLQMMGKDKDGTRYIEKAKEFAKRWKHDAFDKDHYKLTFDRAGTWSLKYNLVWDKLFGLEIFDEDVFETEVSYYKTKMNRYGIPLDSRNDYTKSDWEMWSAVLSDDREYFDGIVSAMLKMLEETPDRVPFNDWYFTTGGNWAGFMKNRTVQGGLFIKLLKFE